MATGKIARLPREIREQVNRRLEDGEPGNRLVAWLNELPAVRALLAAEFGGGVIKEQNLTNWKQGGYRDWRMEREVAALGVGSAEEEETFNAQRPRGRAARWGGGPSYPGHGGATGYGRSGPVSGADP